MPAGRTSLSSSSRSSTTSSSSSVASTSGRPGERERERGRTRKQAPRRRRWERPEPSPLCPPLSLSLSLSLPPSLTLSLSLSLVNPNHSQQQQQQPRWHLASQPSSSRASVVPGPRSPPFSSSIVRFWFCFSISMESFLGRRIASLSFFPPPLQRALFPFSLEREREYNTEMPVVHSELTKTNENDPNSPNNKQ